MKALLVPVVLFAALLAACGNGTTLIGAAEPKPPAIVIAPSFTAQPSDQTVSVGQSAVFSVTATGTAPLTYQWQKGGTAIAGATASSYTTPATALTDSGSIFAVVVSNAAGSKTSNSATLAVSASAIAPTITTQPANQ